MFESVLPFGANIWVILKEFEFFDKKVVEIESGGLLFFGFVTGEDFGDVFLIGIESGGGVIFGGATLVFLTTDN